MTHRVGDTKIQRKNLMFLCTMLWAGCNEFWAPRTDQRPLRRIEGLQSSRVGMGPDLAGDLLQARRAAPSSGFPGGSDGEAGGAPRVGKTGPATTPPPP